MNFKYDVIAAGHICLDMSPKFLSKTNHDIKDIFIPGRLINMDGVDFSAGGPVANTGFAIGKLGLKVFPMANIGQDEFGDILSGIIYKETASNARRIKEVNTSYSVVLSLPGIDRIILHDPAGNNHFTSEHIDFKKLENAKLFHFGYPPLMKSVYKNDGEELVQIFKKAKETGVITSLDMSLPDTESESGKVNWELVLKKALPYVDIFLPSVEEALFMLDRDEYNRVKSASGDDDFTKYLDMAKISALGDKIIQYGTAMTIIKCGSNGIYFKSGLKEKLDKIAQSRSLNVASWANRELFRETYVVSNFKSALAGGDTTIAGFLSAMLEGYDLYDCLKIACKTGALCCTTYDSISGLLPLGDIYDKTKQESERNIYSINLSNCSFDRKSDIWIFDQY